MVSEAPEAPSPAPTRLARLAAGLRLEGGDGYALSVALSFKIGLLLLGALAFAVFQNRYPEGRGLWPWLSIWDRWDTPHYREIADGGYSRAHPENLAFFPLYPLLVRLVRPLAWNDTLSAAFAVSTVASLCAAVGFHRLARLDLGPRAAGRAVWFLFAFPTAYFLHIGYTEGLFFALVFGAMHAARTDRWGRAGLLGALAAATRINGALLLAFFAVEALLRWRETRRFPRAAAWSLLTLAGTGAYLWANWYAAGDPLAFLRHQREHWHHEPTPPWAGLWNSVRFAGWASPADARMTGTAEAVAGFVTLAVGAWALFKQRASYGVWVLLNWALWESKGFVLSGPRYALCAVPLFLLLGRATRDRHAFALATALCLLFQGLLATLFSQGRWAF